MRRCVDGVAGIFTFVVVDAMIVVVVVVIFVFVFIFVFINLIQTPARVPVPDLPIARHGVEGASMRVPPVARLPRHGFAGFVFDAGEVVRDGDAQARQEPCALFRDAAGQGGAGGGCSGVNAEGVEDGARAGGWEARRRGDVELCGGGFVKGGLEEGRGLGGGTVGFSRDGLVDLEARSRMQRILNASDILLRCDLEPALIPGHFSLHASRLSLFFPDCQSGGRNACFIPEHGARINQLLAPVVLLDLGAPTIHSVAGLAFSFLPG